MARQVKRDPSFQAKVMVEGFGADYATRLAVDAMEKQTKRDATDYWNAVVRACRLYLPPPPPPLKPVELTPRERAEKWVMGTGYVYRIVDEASTDPYIMIPVNQMSFGYKQA